MPRRRLAVLIVLGCFLGTCGPAAAHTTSPPVAAYGFEDTGEPGVAGDSSAFGNTGTVAGGAARVAGRSGSALSFDGVDDLVRIPDAGPLNLASELTVEAWVAPTATSGRRSVLFKGRRTDLSYALYAGPKPTGQVSTGGGAGLGEGAGGALGRRMDAPGRHVRRHHAAAVRRRRPGRRERGAQRAADARRRGPDHRRERRVGRVVRGAHRRRARL